MTADYTSGMINQNIKTAAAQNRKFQTATNTLETGGFDSVFENVTKNYTDKSEIKNSKQSSTKYAAETKDVNSAKTTTAKNNQKQQKKVEKTKNTNKSNAYTAETNNFEQVKPEAGTASEKSFVENKNQTKENSTVQETIVSNKESSVIENTIKQEDFIEKPIIDENTEFTEEESISIIQEITNEQIQAIAFNTVTAEPIINDVIEDTIEENVVERPAEDLNKAKITQTVQNEHAALPQAIEQINTVETKSTNVVLEQIAKEAAQNFQTVIQEKGITQQTREQDFVIPQKDVQNFNVEENFVTNNIQVSDENKENLSVEINSEKFNLTETESGLIKTAQESHTADTIRLNLNNNELKTDEDNIVLTPNDTKVQEVKNNDIPVIQVTDEVAQNLKNFTEKTQNRDYAGKVKDKVTEKLSSIQGTDTVVTEVQNTKLPMQSGFESNSGNTSLAQGNASEQAIKMSVENIAERETSPDSFISQLEAKLNATNRNTNLKQPAMLNKSDIMSQLNAKFNEMQQSGQSKVSIILRPENLGRVSVQIMNTNEGIVAKMTTDNQQVRDLLDKNIEALRANLSSQGVNVNNIKVECTNQSENNAMDFERQQFEQNSQDFQGENGRNTNNSNQSKETAFWDNLPSPEEVEEQDSIAERTLNVENTKTITTQNGKISYKV